MKILCEDFKEYVEDNTESIDSVLKGLQEAQNESDSAFSLLKEYFAEYGRRENEFLNERQYTIMYRGRAIRTDDAIPEDEREEIIAKAKADIDAELDGPSGGRNGRPDKYPKSGGGSDDGDGSLKRGSNAIDILNKLITQGDNMLADVNFTDTRGNSVSYTPVVGRSEVRKITEMKFPENIIFFISQFINWIRNVVVSFISSITNAVRRLFGLKTDPEEAFDINKLKLQLERSKDIEVHTIPVTMKKDGPSPLTIIGPKSSGDASRLLTLFDSVELREDDDGSRGANFDYRYTDTASMPRIISVDFSKYIFELKQLLEHFLALADNAYGSNMEHLFKTDDLSLMLELFKINIDSLKSGNSIRYDVNGTLRQAQDIKASRVKDNLLRTQVNTDRLKAAYMETSKKAKTIIMLLGEKKVLDATKYGTSYKFLSAATYKGMIEIVEVLNPRLKQAVKMEKDLEKFQKQYDKVAIELGKMRQSFVGVGRLSFTDTYQKSIGDLFDSARFMSQTVSLRLVAIGLYIKELQDIKSAIISTNSMDGIGSKIKLSRLANF